MLLVTEDTLPSEVERDIARRLEEGLAPQFDRLIVAKNQEAAKDDISEVYDFCSKLAAAYMDNESAEVHEHPKQTAIEGSTEAPPLENEANIDLAESKAGTRGEKLSSFGAAILYGLTTFSLAVAGVSFWRVTDLERAFESRLAERLKEIETEYFQVEVDLESLDLTQRVTNISTATSEAEVALSSLGTRLEAIERLLDEEPTVISQAQLLRQLADGAERTEERWQALNRDLEALSLEITARTSSLRDISSQIASVQERLRENGAIAENFNSRDALISQRISLLTEIQQQERLVADSIATLSALIASVSSESVPRQTAIRQDIEGLRLQVDTLANLLEEVPVSPSVPVATNSDIVGAQTFLQEQDFPIDVDGDWGPASRLAARSFLADYDGPWRNGQRSSQNDANQMNDDELIANLIWIVSQ
ncbi:hypothetical protein [Thalassococcus sp. S3]|uniref:hypothetical protein n=1 Tax=Thalassococcus sp. S3 TaxID=2017482 RepID=UPI001C2BD211|nr:hypothetical protein [Thalassococcus sp. S3]